MIKNRCVPFFCVKCGNRLGWCDESLANVPFNCYCDECAESDEEKENGV